MPGGPLPRADLVTESINQIAPLTAEEVLKLRKELNELKGIPSFDSADDGGQGKTALTRRGIPARSATVAAAATTTLTSAALAGINTASIHSGPAVGGGSRAFRA